MLAMGGEGDLIDRLMEMNIAPLAISYEYDPCRSEEHTSELQSQR